jgi:TRAP-type C4-dicarboxylate transport system substrate-binding protein
MKRIAFVFAFAIGLLAVSAPAEAQTVLKLATQTPASANDARKVVPNVVADAIMAANADLQVKVYYEGQLVTAAEMWRAVREGTIDIGFIFLPTSALDVPEVAILGMPSVLTRREDARRMAGSPAMKLLGDVLEKEGALLMNGYWDTLTIGSTGDCVRRPENLDGIVARGPGRGFEAVIDAAGAIPVPFPASEIPRALRTGAIDMVITSPSSMMVGGGHKFMRCVANIEGYVVGMSQTSMVVSKATFDRLAEKQRTALRDGLAKGAAYMQGELAKGGTAATSTIRATGVKVVELDEADIAVWRKRARETAFREYAGSSPQAAAILQAALQTLGSE